MANEYKLPYTAEEIDEKLGKAIGAVHLTTAEYEALEETDPNIMYILIDAEEETGVGSSVQADYSQNDSSALDHIKNRTHWAEPPVMTTETIFAEAALTFDEYGCSEAEASLFAITTLVAGTELRIMWDGVEYTSVARDFATLIVFGNPVILGIDENPEDNGQPFAVAFNQDEYIFLFMTNDTASTEHTVGITKITTTQEIYKLDSKYLDTSWLAQKTATSVEVVSETTATITPGGADVSSGISDGKTLMSAEYFDVIWNGETYRYNPKSAAGLLVIGNLALLDPASPDTGEPFGFMTDGATLFCLTSEEVEATFNIIGYFSAYNTLPVEYLPEQLQYGYEHEAEILKDIITWDGDTTGRANVENVFYHVSNAIPTVEDLLNGGTLSDNSGASITFDSDDVNASNPDVIMINGCVYILSKYMEVGGFASGIYFMKSSGTAYVSGFTINNCSFVETETKMKTIDPMCLPEECFGAVSGSGLPEVTADDNGKTVNVVDGEWVVKQMSYADLDASTATNGAFLRVVDGAWAAVVLPNAEEGLF